MDQNPGNGARLPSLGVGGQAPLRLGREEVDGVEDGARTRGPQRPVGFGAGTGELSGEDDQGRQVVGRNDVGPPQRAPDRLRAGHATSIGRMRSRQVEVPRASRLIDRGETDGQAEPA